MTPVLEVRDLQKKYTVGQFEVLALRGVNLQIATGEFVVLLGASGSGKSTLLNILGGLDFATSGSLFYRGQEFTDASPQMLTEYRRSHVGFVFQFYNLISNLTATENIEIVTDLVEASLQPEEALRLVGLGDRINHFPSQLSGGEQQRVFIARAIAKKPDVLLCDEPTGALDLATGKLVLQAIQRVHQELGTTVIIITHNTAIAGLADRVIYLSEGQIRQDQKMKRRSHLMRFADHIYFSPWNPAWICFCRGASVEILGLDRWLSRRGRNIAFREGSGIKSSFRGFI